MRDDEPVPLPPKVWETLLALVENHGRLLTKDDLLQRVWRGTIVEEGSLTKCISQLRKVLETASDGQEYIQTVPTKGYRFLAQVEIKAVSLSQAASEQRQPESADSDLIRRRASLVTDITAPLRIPSADSSASRVFDPVEAPAPEHVRRRPRLLWIGIVAAAALLLGALYWAVQPPPLKVTGFHRITNDGRGKLNSFRGGVPGAMLTDGTRIYFTELNGSNFEPAEVAVAGGETVPIHLPGAPPDLIPLEISHDGTKLLASVQHRLQPENPFWILPVPTFEPLPLGDLLGHDGTWSPDGRTFVYARGHALYVASGQGVAENELVSLPGVAWWIRFSPDGRRLRFTLEEEKSEAASLWEVRSDGSNLHPLLSGWSQPPSECCGSWTPDGMHYVFQSSKGGNTQIWSVRDQSPRFLATSAAPVKLTQGPMEFRSPVLSRDGRKMFAVGAERRGELVRYDPSSGEFNLYLSGISADHVEFSRDQQWIAYSAYPDATIWRSKADGSDRLQLSFPPLDALFPRWSPDGKQIAFLGYQPGGPMRVYRVPRDRGTPELMLSSGSSEVDPNWSPDGSRIMFGALRPGVGPESNPTGDIEIFNFETQQLSKLPGSDGLTAPRWSPDGRYVVAKPILAGNASDPALLLYDFQLGTWTPFEQDPADNKWWSHDGRYFYFDKFPEKDPAIFRERLSDRQIEKVVSLSPVRRAWGSLGWWFGLAPDDSPILLRDVSIEEIYGLDLSGE